MMQYNISPIECMLYASKTVNNKMGNNYRFMQMCADVIYLTAKKKRICIDSLEHIIKNWTWANQLKICIWASGKIGDEKLLDYIYKRFSTDDSFKYFCFAALIDSAKQIFIHEILEMVSKLDDIYEIDKQMANYFHKQFLKNFQSNGLDQIESLIDRSSRGTFANKVLMRITGKKNEKNIIDDAVEAAKSKEQTKIEKIFINCKQLIENKSNMTNMAVIAMGFLKHPETGSYLLNCIKKKKTFSTAQMQQIIITFGHLKYENVKDILHELENNEQLKCHVWYSLYLMGENNFLEIIIKTFLMKTKIIC